ncbi:MAG: RNA polymerase sigma factor [Verrucomicrobia bacterium]|nr:RNA polymerase sigma factor [Verrucomicrobiota bacterium]
MPADSAQFEAVVDAHYKALYRFAYSLTLSEADAGDLTQETFYIWASKSQQIRDGDKSKSWLFTTLHRLFLNRKRREKRFPEEPLDFAAEDLVLPEDPLSFPLDGETVLRMLHSMEEAHRVPLAMFYLEDLTYQEIAQALDLPMGTVMSRLSRGKLMLRKLLSQRTSREAESQKIISLIDPHNTGTGGRQ